MYYYYMGDFSFNEKKKLFLPMLPISQNNILYGYGLKRITGG